MEIAGLKSSSREPAQPKHEYIERRLDTRCSTGLPNNSAHGKTRFYISLPRSQLNLASLQDWLVIEFAADHLPQPIARQICNVNGFRKFATAEDQHAIAVLHDFIQVRGGEENGGTAFAAGDQLLPNPQH